MLAIQDNSSLLNIVLKGIFFGGVWQKTTKRKLFLLKIRGYIVSYISLQKFAWV